MGFPLTRANLPCTPTNTDLGGATVRRANPLTTPEPNVAEALGRAIAHRIGEPRYQLWFERHTKFVWQDGLLTVGVPNRHFEEWLEKTFGGAVADASREVFGRPMQVRFTIDPELFQAARREQAEAHGSQDAHSEQLHTPVPRPAPAEQPAPRRRAARPTQPQAAPDATTPAAPPPPVAEEAPAPIPRARR